MRPKSPRRVVEFAQHATIGIQLRRQHRHGAGLSVDLDASVRVRTSVCR